MKEEMSLGETLGHVTLWEVAEAPFQPMCKGLKSPYTAANNVTHKFCPISRFSGEGEWYFLFLLFRLLFSKIGYAYIPLEWAIAIESI